MAAAQGTAKRQHYPVDGLLGGVANAHTSELDRLAVRAVFGK
jgi:hypothetical protein